MTFPHNTKTLPNIVERKKVFSTPWFSLVAKTVETDSAPFYSLELADYVSIVALTTQQEILLVKQYRPAIEQYTLELPSGHIEPDELPVETARRELLEETGYQVADIELLGVVVPDTGRLSNRMWCYFANNAQLTSSPTESGIEIILCSQAELATYVLNGQFDHALHQAALLQAYLMKKLVME